MLGWKQRLYAFLLRRVVGPFLDEKAANKLHDSIDFSLQDGLFVLKNVAMNASRLSEQLLPYGFSVTKATVQRLEIRLTLQENTGSSQSSLAWRAMKLGTSSEKESVPAVSLIAEVHVRGLDVEIHPVPNASSTMPTVQGEDSDMGTPAPSRIRSYMEAVISSLQLTVKLSDLNIKIRHANSSLSLYISSVTFKDHLTRRPTDVASQTQQSPSKSLEFSDITVRVGGEKEVVVALARGSGRVLFRVSGSTSACTTPETDIEASLNHQVNISFDVTTIGHLRSLATGFAVTRTGTCSDTVDFEVKAPEPLAPQILDDEEDLRAITGIMKQYREAYHLAQTNQFRGGVLIPSHAYLDDLDALEEDDPMTFDVFWDAQEQSVHHASSRLEESTLQSTCNRMDQTSDSRTKVRLVLLSVSVKSSFRELRSQAGPQEYVLATMDDLQVCFFKQGLESKLEFTISHFAIEDAQLVETSRKATSSQLDIGTILCFDMTSKEAEDFTNEIIDSHVPCIRICIAAESAGSKSIECNLHPLELYLRHRSLSNLVLFARKMSDSSVDNNTTTTSASKQPAAEERVIFTVHCPSVFLFAPLLGFVSTAPLFDRCGETIADSPMKDSCLGLTMNTLEFGWCSTDPSTEDRGVESAARLTVYHILLFASAPTSNELCFGSSLQRMDFMVMNARTEVEPCIPISLDVKKVRPPSREGHDSFPLVAMISSFKTRQADEDTEMDQRMDSILDGNEQVSKMKHNGTDSQMAMVAAAEKSQAVINLTIPEITCDLTKAELVKITEMLQYVTPVGSDRDDSPAEQSNELTVSLSLQIDQISLSLKQDTFADRTHEGTPRQGCSFLLAIDTFRSHVLVCGSSMHHLRLLLHDVAFYSVDQTGVAPEAYLTRTDIQARIDSIKQRIKGRRDAKLSPIIFRSKFFAPICNEAPSFLLDILDSSRNEKGSTPSGSVQKQINLIFYHLTFRLDPDSDWLDCLRDGHPATSDRSTDQHEKTSLLSRVFVSLTDCNIDYISPKFFQTASRNVIRVGDLRCSSNILLPFSHRQAFSFSIGDVSCHVTNERLSRASEDIKLCRASLFGPYTPARLGKKSRAHGITAEALLREDGFVEILTLDSADAVLVATKRDDDVDVAIDLSLGLLSMSACKDSFQCLVASVAEIQTKLTALSEDDLAALKRDSEQTKPAGDLLVSLPPDEGTSERSISIGDDEMLLDGYEWTEVDHDPLREVAIPDGEEQIALWYLPDSERTNKVPTGIPGTRHRTNLPLRIINQHFPFSSSSGPLACENMNATRDVDSKAQLQVKTRLVVHKLAIKLRLHDGYDWPGKVSDQEKFCLRQGSRFVVAPLPKVGTSKASADTAGKIAVAQVENSEASKRVQILASLLEGQETEDGQSPFENAPLPEDRARTFEDQSHFRRLSKKNKVYLQVSANGVSVKLDAYRKSESHRLTSVLKMSIADMFIAEAASALTPVKMLGEWVNENEHPRDTRCGMLMLKMVTWAPARPLSADGEIQSDECEMTMKLLPMRAIIDQRAIQFAQGFFHKVDTEDTNDWRKGLHLVPPPRFRAFRVKKWKLKVDYIPQKLDVDALRDGCIVELVNLSPIDGMVITLSQVTVEDSVGFGDALGDLTGNWLQEIVSTQLYKFLTNARPFEPISDVGQGITDLVVLPYEAFKSGDDVRRAVSSGMKSLAGTVAFQALTTSSRLTEYAANRMAAIVGGRYQNRCPLPTRPTAAPRGVQDVTAHAMESLARGFQAANYKIVIVPYREYSRHGAMGAADSVLRGIPVMLVAPVTGAAEALSYTLLGARNALRPDIRREEEASRTGFTHYDV